MTDVRNVYRLLTARLPHHAGTGTSGLVPAPVAAIADPVWLAAQLAASGRLYRFGDRPVLGVLWWYSASSVLLAPTVESLVVTGVALDPTRVTLHLHPDGRLLAATSDAISASPVDALWTALDSAITAVAEVSGARARTLWAIAADSLANRVLWAGGRPEFAVALGGQVKDLPTPRFVSVNGRDYVRRGSCCLVFEATGGDKCVSCPRQRPEERMRRLRAI
ncbi:(2Fe-2S)-binding protein [Actinokineospora sp. NBRC 105648]|uniref:(2Fe-2S)-binding protein n=1 Tax=Actinokineospora sp. NBRC 105648 TaxID=3032206 RepID=UPI0024A108D2|nr:(2Fe-2S)-binding protein [Actinokineospora sp. NBRC 105648]GLZ43009.1 Fe-S oxidoreductase [Actinokineospora sp. NBRC 105648]